MTLVDVINLPGRRNIRVVKLLRRPIAQGAACFDTPGWAEPLDWQWVVEQYK